MRGAEDLILKKRNKKETTFLVTGATGFLGSHIAVELLRKGYFLLILCRPKNNLIASQRFRQLLKWFGIDGHDPSKYKVIQGYIDQPQFGLKETTFDYLLDTVDEVFHCAAETSFSERKRKQVETTNIMSLENVLDFAIRSNTSFFHHISTCYVMGQKSGLCEEKISDNNLFYNIYEESKHKGEVIVTRACRENGIRLNIYRPSIVYGDSNTGKCMRFNALYFPIKTALLLKDIYVTDIEEHDGERAKEMGVKIEEGNSVYLPIRLEKNDRGRINVIPVNFFIEATMAIMEESLEGNIFHIVSDKPKKLERIIGYAKKLFLLDGIRAVSKKDFQEQHKNSLEILFDNYIKVYGPYIRDTRVFSEANTKPILRRRNISCPEFTYDIFKKCMSYAVEVDWGRRLFTG